MVTWERCSFLFPAALAGFPVKKTTTKDKKGEKKCLLQFVDVWFIKATTEESFLFPLSSSSLLLFYFSGNSVRVFRSLPLDYFDVQDLKILFGIISFEIVLAEVATT